MTDKEVAQEIARLKRQVKNLQEDISDLQRGMYGET